MTRQSLSRSETSEGRFAAVSLLATLLLGLCSAPSPFDSFVPLPGSLLLALCAITGSYVVATETLKRWFFRARPAPARA
jgi:hypothetical protein